MGSSESRSMEVLKYFQRQWEYIQTNQNGLKMYRNRDSDQEAEMHNVAIEPKVNLLKEYDIYNYRRVQDNALVGAYAVQNLKDTAPNLCGNRDMLKVMIQSIHIRASQFRRLTFEESLYMLSESIRGFDDCYSKVGTFDITDQMIGLNRKGQVKVWLNQNFAQNHPTRERPLLQITQANEYRMNNEQQQFLMLGQLISLVSKKCQGGFPQDFDHTIRRQYSFTDAYHSVQEYCKTKQVDIPDRISLQNVENYNVGPEPSVERRYQQQKAVKMSDCSKDNFSFKDHVNKSSNMQSPRVMEQREDTMFTPSRETLINRLPRDTMVRNNQSEVNDVRIQKVETRNNFDTQPNIYSTFVTPSYLTATKSRAPVNFTNYNTSPIKESRNSIRYDNSIRYEPKVSVKNYNVSQTLARVSSPPQSPRGINFSYQNQPSQPDRTHFVTSQRF